MDVFECIKQRRAIAYYKDTPVPDDLLEKILDAGRWAPSAVNIQPVEFVVVKEKESREKIRKLVIEAWEVEQGFDGMDAYGLEDSMPFWKERYNAPVMVIVIADGEKRETTVYSSTAYYSMASDAACAAIMNIMLAAHAMGLGSLWLTFPDPIKLKYLFGIPKTMGVAGVVNLGYPVEWPKEGEIELNIPGMYIPDITPRRPLADMVHYEKFDEDKWQKYRTMVLYGPVIGKDRKLKSLSDNP